jgi:hypothetical protein
MLLGLGIVDEKTVIALVEQPHKGIGEVLLFDTTHDPFQLLIEVPK